MKAVYSIFAYLSNHTKAPMSFDPAYPKINLEDFPSTDWTQSIYGEVSEELPHNMPEPRGMPVQVACFVDADHAEDKSNRRSQTGFVIYVNNAPIDWFSKKQATVESSTFGSELVAMRVAVERIKALRYKLRMFGIPISGPTYLHGDNVSVVNSAAKVETRLHKKHNAICWHVVREAAAAGIIRVGWIKTDENQADLFTKQLPTQRRKLLLNCFFHRGIVQDARVQKG